jgi:alpha-glucosidase
LSWLPYDQTVLAFTRDSGLTCMTNLGTEAMRLPAGEILLTSGPLEDGALPPDTTAWLAPLS